MASFLFANKDDLPLPMTSISTAALTTGLLKSATLSVAPDYAEALQQSMLALMAKKGFEHPMSGRLLSLPGSLDIKFEQD